MKMAERSVVDLPITIQKMKEVFDEKKYLTDVKINAGSDPFSHFMDHGWRNGGNLNALMDTAYYLSKNADVRDAGINPALHYFEYGWREGRDPSPYFSTEFYSKENHDVVEAGINPLYHFLLWGGAEGRNPSPSFQCMRYIEEHPEVDFLVVNPLVHYLLHRLPGEERTSVREKIPEAYLGGMSIATKFPPQKIVPRSASGVNMASLKIDWIVPPFVSGQGGHTTIFRLVRELERQGHICRIWLNGFFERPHNGEWYKNLIRLHYFDDINADVDYLPDDLESIEGDAIVATDCWTAYPVRSIPNYHARFYLIQDFEPLFFPMGSRYLLAQNTYSFGFKCLCAGPWLFQKATREFGQRGWCWELAVDHAVYNDKGYVRDQKNVAIYARGHTERRAVELVLAAVNLLLEEFDDITFTLFGGNYDQNDLPRRVIDAGILPSRNLAEIYNKSSVGVVFSATNYSLVPREMMACGLPVIEVASDSSKLSFPGGTVNLSMPDPHHIAGSIRSLLDDPDLRSFMSAHGKREAQKYSWEKTGSDVASFIRAGLAEALASGE